MNTEHNSRWVAVVVTAGLFVAAQGPAAAQEAKGQSGNKKAPAVVAAPDTQDLALARYLEASRAIPAAEPFGWMQNLGLDLRARRINDILTVRVEESIAATGTTDAAVAKSTSTGAGISTLFGLQSKLPAGLGLGDLATTQSGTDFRGTGSTARASVLTATLSARVADVMPNGDLLVEGIREIEINGDRQIVMLTGVARVVDIGPGNVVMSSALGQLSIRYFGRGLTKGSMSPGWLVRILNKVF